MKEKKEIPWELIISTAFSGFGIAVLSWLKDMLTDFFTIDFLQKYGNIVVFRKDAVNIFYCIDNSYLD